MPICLAERAPLNDSRAAAGSDISNSIAAFYASAVCCPSSILLPKQQRSASYRSGRSHTKNFGIDRSLLNTDRPHIGTVVIQASNIFLPHLPRYVFPTLSVASTKRT